MSSKFLNLVIEVFGSDAELMDFREEEDRIVVTGRRFLANALWRSLSKMVKEEFGGKYSSVERGWVIPKPETEEPTRTGYERIDEKLEEIEAERELGPMRGVDPYTGLPVDDEKAEARQETVLDLKAVEGFRMIAVDAMVTSPVKLRHSIDDVYLAGLAETIRDKGILQPILVRPLKGERFQVVAGEQRYRAAQDAGLKEIPCMVKILDDREASEAALIENDQRKDITDYERARAYKNLLEKWPSEYPNQKVLAFKMGKSEKWVSEHLAILELEGEIPPGEFKRITHTQAKELRAIPDEKREEIIREIAETGVVPSKREIEAKVKPKKTRKRRRAKFHCDFCGQDRKDYQVHVVPGRGFVCDTCGRNVDVREVEPAKKPKPVFEDFQVPCDFCTKGDTCDRSLFHAVGDGRYTCDEYVEKTKPKEPKKAKVPPVHFRERMRVTVSQAERDVHVDLLRAYHDKRLLVEPFLNDDRSLSYVVRASYPDIGFYGVEVPIYLDNEDVHKGREDWDEDVVKALERHGAHPERFSYTGTLGVGARKDIVEKIIVKVNALKGDG